MKIETFKEPGRDHTVRLKLVDIPGGVRLDAVNQEGERLQGGSILSIVPSGIVRHGGIFDSHGLPTDSKGYVKLPDESSRAEMPHKTAAIAAKCRRVIAGKNGHMPVLANGCEVVYMDELKEVFEYLGQQ